MDRILNDPQHTIDSRHGIFNCLQMNLWSIEFLSVSPREHENAVPLMEECGRKERRKNGEMAAMHLTCAQGSRGVRSDTRYPIRMYTFLKFFLSSTKSIVIYKYQKKHGRDSAFLLVSLLSRDTGLGI